MVRAAGVFIVRTLLRGTVIWQKIDKGTIFIDLVSMSPGAVRFDSAAAAAALTSFQVVEAASNAKAQAKNTGKLPVC